jgi:hypothetical protein
MYVNSQLDLFFVVSTHLHSQLAILTPIYSTSVELSATEVLFLLNHVIIVDPRLKQHLKVIFISTTLPSQYDYEYPYNLTFYPPRYLNP